MDTHDLAMAAELVLQRLRAHDDAAADLCEALEDWRRLVGSQEQELGGGAYSAGRQQMAADVLALLRDRLTGIRTGSLAGLQLRSLIDEIKKMK